MLTAFSALLERARRSGPGMPDCATSVHQAPRWLASSQPQPVSLRFLAPSPSLDRDAMMPCPCWPPQAGRIHFKFRSGACSLLCLWTYLFKSVRIWTIRLHCIPQQWPERNQRPRVTRFRGGQHMQKPAGSNNHGASSCARGMDSRIPNLRDPVFSASKVRPPLLAQRASSYGSLVYYEAGYDRSLFCQPTALAFNPKPHHFALAPS